MATIHIIDQLHNTDLSVQKRDFISMCRLPEMEYKLQIVLTDLALSISSSDGNHFYTSDIRSRLDQLTNGFFTAQCGTNQIVACIYFPQKSISVGMRLEVYGSDQKVICFIEDVDLSTLEIEYLYDLVSAYENDHQLPVRMKRYSVKERILDDIQSFDYSELREPAKGCYEAIVQALQYDMADLILKEKTAEQIESLDAEIFSNAFWRCLACRLRSTEEEMV